MGEIEEIKDEIISNLKDKFEGAEIESEYGGPSRFVIHVIWEEFRGVSEEDRQDMVWGFLHDNFPYEKIKRVGFIMTWTPEELEFYEKEYGESITTSDSSK